MANDESNIRDYLAVAIAAGVRNPAGSAYKRYGVARQTVSRHLRALVDDGIIEPTGKTRARHYRIVLADRGTWTAALGDDIAEHELWQEWLAPRLADCSENVRDICHYGFTEMMNNVIDHSGSPQVALTYQRSLATVRMAVVDFGVGIFQKLQHDLGFEGKRDAVFELCKGKLTTDPARHTGEGIFFTSRMFDVFMLSSDELCLGRYWGGRDTLLEDVGAAEPGTSVTMTIALRSDRQMKDIFDHYTATKEDFGFAKTVILVNLARTGTEQLVSRSQARRLLARFKQFKEIILDFAGVEIIGPAFADEIFRVFRSENPNYRVTWMNTSAAVDRMIKKAHAVEPEPPEGAPSPR